MAAASSRRGPADGNRRIRGAVLAEFALLGFVVWLLLAGVLEIGRALTAQQLIQHASRTMAREMARLPLPADLDFAAAIQEDAFRNGVLNPDFLVIDSALLARCGIPDFGQPGHEAALNDYFDRELPIGNQLLRPLMIADRRGDNQMIRYPGALLVRAAPPGPACDAGSQYAVGIAELNSATGTVTWHGVVEQHGAGGGRDFALAGGGWVGLRVNYPFQSAGLLAAESTGVTDPRTGRVTQRVVDADAAISDDADSFDALPGTLATGAADGGAYGGPRALGRLYSLPDADGEPQAVRPFRRLLSANAGFRREVFLAPTAGVGGTP